MSATCSRIFCVVAVLATSFVVSPIAADAWYDYAYDYGYPIASEIVYDYGNSYDDFNYYDSWAPMDYYGGTVGYGEYGYGGYVSAHQSAYPYSYAYPQTHYAYQFNSPYVYSYSASFTGDYIPYLNEPLCNYPGYGRYSCLYHPAQPLYDYWTGTWY